MKKLILLFIFLLNLSCDDEKICPPCMTPPPSFIFEIQDANSDENLFTNETFSAQEISVVDENNHTVDFSFITENEINLIDLSTIGWNMGKHGYRITLNSNYEFNILLHMKERKQDCCLFFETINFEITDQEYSQNNSTGIYHVKIELIPNI